jgi:Domain of unknown function (DUF5753)
VGAGTTGESRAGTANAPAGWWDKYRDLNVPYIALEPHASSITSYTTRYFPALLQTANYARAIISTIAPYLESEILEGRIEARLRRQGVLDSPSTVHYEVLIDEGVLSLPIGGPKVSYEQIDKVLATIREHKVDLKIVPSDSVSQDSNFVILQFPEPGVPRSVWIEGLAAYQHFDDKKEKIHVDRYLEEVERLKKSALGFGDSIDLLERARDAYRDD